MSRCLRCGAGNEWIEETPSRKPSTKASAKPRFWGLTYRKGSGGSYHTMVEALTEKGARERGREGAWANGFKGARLTECKELKPEKGKP